MSDPLPKSIIVIHGVGDHKEDATASDFAHALARVQFGEAKWIAPTLVAKRGDVQSSSGSKPDAEVFRFGVFDINVPESGMTHRLSIYELYWSKLSRSGEGFLAEVRRDWQFLVGLPRIGFQALFPNPTCRGAAAYTIARGAYCTAWVLAVLRLVAAFTSMFMIAYLKVSWMRYYDLLLIFDLLLSASLVILDACLVAILATQGLEAFRSSCVAALFLAIMIVLTQALPLTIAEVTRFDQVATALDDPPNFPWYSAPDSTPPTWHYSINNLTGFTPYFVYGLVVIWAVLIMGVLYLFVTRSENFVAGETGKDEAIRCRVARRMKWVVNLTNFFLRVLGVIVLVVAPSMLLFDYTTVFLLSKGSFMAPWGPDQLGKNPLPFLQFVWIYFLSYTFIMFLWVIIGSSRLRREITPALELVYDVTSYFPAIPLIDRYRLVSYLLGGHGGQRNRPELAETLRDRLQSMILYAAAEPDPSDGQPATSVAVVGHSLGSVIALAALRDWRGSPPGVAGPDLCSSQANPVPQIHLVTMGSPFSMLSHLFPHIFGPGSAQPMTWSLPLVRRWFNVYRAADLVGRELDFAAIERVNPELSAQNENPSNGGHDGYFADILIAKCLLRWLFADGHQTCYGELRGGHPVGTGRGRGKKLAGGEVPGNPCP